MIIGTANGVSYIAVAPFPAALGEACVDGIGPEEARLTEQHGVRGGGGVTVFSQHVAIRPDFPAH